jgi:hypothetical protein
MVHIDIPNTYTSSFTFLAWYILISLTHIHQPSLFWHGTYWYSLHIYITPHFPGMVHIDIPYTYTSSFTFLAWYILIFLTHIHHPSLSWHGTYTSALTFLAWYILIFLTHIHHPSLFWHGTYWYSLHIYIILHFPGMVHIDIPYTYKWPLTFLAWHIYMTPHFPGMAHIHDSPLSWHGTNTSPLTFLARYILISLTHIHQPSLSWHGTYWYC